MEPTLVIFPSDTLKLSTVVAPKSTVPVVVKLLEPISIAPNPEVMLPAFNAPTVVTFESVSSADSK